MCRRTRVRIIITIDGRMIRVCDVVAQVLVSSLNCKIQGVWHRVNHRIWAIECECAAEPKSHNGSGYLHLQHRTSPSLGLRQSRDQIHFAVLNSTIDLRYRSCSAAGSAADRTAKHTRVVGTANGYRRIIGITRTSRIDGDRIDRIPSRKLLSDRGRRCSVHAATPAEADRGQRRCIAGATRVDVDMVDRIRRGSGSRDICHRRIARTASAAEAHCRSRRVSASSVGYRYRLESITRSGSDLYVVAVLLAAMYGPGRSRTGTHVYCEGRTESTRAVSSGIVSGIVHKEAAG